MILVGAALGDHVDVGAGVPAIRSVVLAGLNFEFLNGVRVGNGDTGAEVSALLDVVDANAIHLEIVVGSPVASGYGGILVVAAAATAQFAGVRDFRRYAGVESDDLGKVAHGERKRFDLFAGGDAAERTGFCLELSDLRFDDHCLRNLADLEPEGESVGFRDGNLHVRDANRAEAGLADFDVIRARQEQGNDKVAGGVGGDGTHFARSFAGNFHLCAADAGAGLIRHGAGESAGARGLRGGDGGHGEEK